MASAGVQDDRETNLLVQLLDVSGVDRAVVDARPSPQLKDCPYMDYMPSDPIGGLRGRRGQEASSGFGWTRTL